jgi:hypothetical protein
MKTTTPLTAQERVILFCTATGVSHAAVGITAHAMQSMAIKGFLVHDRESGAYALMRIRAGECRPGHAGAAGMARAQNIQHTVRYTELAPDRFKNFWRD